MKILLQTTKSCLTNSVEENEEVLEVLGGRFEGKLCSAKDVEADFQTAKQRRNACSVPGHCSKPDVANACCYGALCLPASLHCLDNKSQQNL